MRYFLPALAFVCGTASAAWVTDAENSRQYKAPLGTPASTPVDKSATGAYSYCNVQVKLGITVPFRCKQVADPPQPTPVPVPVPPPTTGSDAFINSAECSRSDASRLLCEDFETPGASGGRWYAEDCDTANRNGGVAQRTKGWCGSIFANPITPPGAEICGSAGVKSNCAGNHGQTFGGSGGRNMAEHAFTARTDEIYVRYYQKWLPGYSFGAEKVLSFNHSVGGGIKWGNLHLNCGAGSARATGNLQWQPVGGGFTSCLPITTINSGVWYYIEIHAKLSTTTTSADGRLRVWVNDCGADGTTCGAAPTLRLDRQAMSWDRKAPGELLGALWWENWANPGSAGTSYIDQIVVSRQPIGFMK